MIPVHFHFIVDGGMLDMCQCEHYETRWVRLEGSNIIPLPNYITEIQAGDPLEFGGAPEWFARLYREGRIHP